MRMPTSSRAAPATGWCGSPGHVRAQQRLYEHAEWIREQDGLLSLGRSLLVLVPRSVDALALLVERFGRVLVLCEPEHELVLVDGLRAQGWHPQTRYRLHEVPARAVLEAGARFSPARVLPPGHALRVVDDATPTRVVEEIQALHLASGLDPLSECFLRGVEDACRTFYLLDPEGEVVGCGTAQDLGPARADRDGWTLGQNVCVGPRLRGRGLGRWLIHCTDMLGIETFGAHHVCSVVAQGVVASASIGAELPSRQRVIFVDTARVERP